jgi:hypothetical protein
MWGDDRFSRLSKPLPNAQTLWVYLLTGPHTTAFPGVFVAGEAGLAEALQWPLKAFQKAFAELLTEGMVKRDRVTRLMFIPKAIRHSPPQSPNVVIAWRHIFNDLPDCTLKQEVFDGCLKELLVLGKGEAYLKAFGDRWAMPMPNPDPDPDPDPEPEHEHEHDPEPVLTFGQFENVKLTEKEKRKLDERYGPEDAAERIEALSEGIASKGYKYTSHYATILSWDRKNGAKNGNGKGQNTLPGTLSLAAQCAGEDSGSDARRLEVERVRRTLERSRGTAN